MIIYYSDIFNKAEDEAMIRHIDHLEAMKAERKACADAAVLALGRYLFSMLSDEPFDKGKGLELFIRTITEVEK